MATCSARSSSIRRPKRPAIKPIIGCEVYLAPGKRTDRTQVPRSDDFDGGGNFHLILLAQNRDGYRNLCRLLTTAYQDGLYYKPRIDKEILTELSRRADRAVGMPVGRNRAMAARGSHGQGARDRRVVREDVPGPLLPRTAGQQAAFAVQRGAPRNRQAGRAAAGRDQRLPLPASRRRQGARSFALHPDRQDDGRRDALAVRYRRVVRQDARRDGDRVRRRFRGRAQQRRDCAANRFRIRVRQVPFPGLQIGGESEAMDLDAEMERRAREGLERRGSPRFARAAPTSTSRSTTSARSRATGHPRHGLRGLHADRRRLHRLRARQGHSGRSRPRLGGRLAWFRTRSESPKSIRSSIACCSSDG